MSSRARRRYRLPLIPDRTALRWRQGFTCSVSHTEQLCCPWSGFIPAIDGGRAASRTRVQRTTLRGLSTGFQPMDASGLWTSVKSWLYMVRVRQGRDGPSPPPPPTRHRDIAPGTDARGTRATPGALRRLGQLERLCVCWLPMRLWRGSAPLRLHPRRYRHCRDLVRAH